MKNVPFWERPLTELSHEQWEMLCDNCGRCCLFKLEDDETGEVVYTELACELFDPVNCRCSDYPNRIEIIPTCLQITPQILQQKEWLPRTCAYRRRFENKPLPKWHPLISGNKKTVEDAGISVRNRVRPSNELDAEYLMEYVVTWID